MRFICQHFCLCGWICCWLSGVCIYAWSDLQIAHVRYLRQALTAAGATAVPCPSLALSPAIFTAAATAAVSALNDTIATNTSATAFNPYSSDAAFYLGAYIFEDVGVTAYKGAVKVLQSQAYATIAAGIEAVEAGHAAIIRYQLYQIASSDTGLYLNSGDAITFETAVTAINALRDALGGTSSSSVESPLTRTPTAVSGVTIASPGPDLFAADANSVAFTRIPKQVLDIVYFGSYTTPGGYFPYGIAGNTDVDNINGTSTTDSCASSGAWSSSLSAFVPLLVASIAVVCGVLYY
ncbi:TPA: hypothetical protein ACH3X2_011706 [Trebouxia sp. C0005]